jgi:hypothetical protein
MERLRVRIETPQTPRIRLNVRLVLTEEDKEVKHIIEESEGRLQAERTRRREQPQGAGPHGRGKTGKIQKRQEDTESSAAGSVEEVGRRLAMDRANLLTVDNLGRLRLSFAWTVHRYAVTGFGQILRL